MPTPKNYRCSECEAGGSCYYLGKVFKQHCFAFICEKGHRQYVSYSHCSFCGGKKERHLSAPKEKLKPKRNGTLE